MTPTEDELATMDFLTDEGQRFCLHFGYENAIDKATAIAISELEEPNA